MSTFFISTFDYPSRYAHAIHGLEMARALARREGTRFLFVCNTAVDPQELAGIRYRELFGRFGRRVKKLRLRRILFLPAILGVMLRERPDVIYTTEPGLYLSGLLLSRLFGARFIAECHGALSSWQTRVFLRADVRIVVTEGIRERFRTGTSSAGGCIVLPNAVDVARFDAVTASQDALRDGLSLPRGRFLIGYIGRFEPLGTDKGLHLMIDALPELSLDTDIVLVGGARAEVEAYRRYADERGYSARVFIVPHVDPREVPRYAKACDVLAYIPPSNEFTEIETSPMKLYEYMASERPIIVSDTRAMREVLHDDEAQFVEPGSLQTFVAAVTSVRATMGDVRERARRAHVRIASMTWDKRAEKIVQSARDVV